MKNAASDLSSALDAIAAGRHGDPFAVLGQQHDEDGNRIVRSFQPQAESVALVDRHGEDIGAMRREHPAGIFTGELPARLQHYQLRVSLPGGGDYVIEDPYRFPSILGDVDRYLLGEGSHRRIYSVLGAHVDTIRGVSGARFSVWAPNASRASVVGEFNGWDGRRHPMRLHPDNGIWEIFIPGIAPGDKYKYELLDRHGRLLPLKSDPFAQAFEPPPGNASLVYKSAYDWQDAEWMSERGSRDVLHQPMSVYEVHLGSWRRRAQEGNRSLSYRELADELVAYAVEQGFTHLELLPVTEHPFDGSWGYQPTGLFAPTWRFGPPDDFRYFVDCAHRAGLGVILDWVPAHFPKDEHGLARFDGTALYEHEDPRKGEHTDWGTLIFNYGRPEVRNYLIGSAICWIEEFHVDGLRVDAVASMLYLDYSREPGEWEPNQYGGNENLEAVHFLQQLNDELRSRGALVCAEESTSWPGVSRPVRDGGLGFTYKWNMGWMNDTLAYMKEDPLHRKHHHERMTFGLMYAFSENFILPLSHDEVVHGKRSLLGRMPGDEWQRFANLRAYLSSMYCHPGKKLLFMGAEIAPYEEWNHDASLPWHLLQYGYHRGVQSLIRDLNRLHREVPALHEADTDRSGFEWISGEDRDFSTFSWLRFDRSRDFVVCVMNFTPVVRYDCHIGVPAGGRYREILNSDAEIYGGSNAGNAGAIETVSQPAHGRPQSLPLTVPPLATLILKPESI